MWRLARMTYGFFSNSSRRSCANSTLSIFATYYSSQSSSSSSSSLTEELPKSFSANVTSINNISKVYNKNFKVSNCTWERISQKNCVDGFSNSDRFLRLAIDSGGCHGFVYKFTFESFSSFNPDEDLLIRESDVEVVDVDEGNNDKISPSVVIDKLSVEKMENATIDYHSELKGAAFVVVGNELIDESCACAMSFSLKPKGKRKLYQPSINPSKSNFTNIDHKNNDNSNNQTISSATTDTTMLSRSRGRAIQRKK